MSETGKECVWGGEASSVCAAWEAWGVGALGCDPERWKNGLNL